MADITSLATGLAQGLGAYLEGGIKQKREQENTLYKTGLETQQKSQLQAEQETLELNKQSQLQTQKNQMEDLLTPEMADKALPGLGKLVQDYNSQRPDNPLKLKEGTDYLKTALSALDTSKDDQKVANREQRHNTAALQFSEQLQRNDVYKVIKAQGISLQSVDRLVNLMKEGNTVAGAALGAKMARAMGEVGVLTEEDVARYRRSGALGQKAADTALQWLQGSPTKATMAEVQQIANVLKERHEEKVQPIYDDYVNRLSENMGMSREEAARRLNVPYAGSVQQGSPKAAKKTNNDPLDLGI